jgi:hypothetical protein
MHSLPPRCLHAPPTAASQHESTCATWEHYATGSIRCTFRSSCDAYGPKLPGGLGWACPTSTLVSTTACHSRQPARYTTSHPSGWTPWPQVATRTCQYKRHIHRSAASASWAVADGDCQQHTQCARNMHAAQAWDTCQCVSISQTVQHAAGHAACSPNGCKQLPIGAGRSLRQHHGCRLLCLCPRSSCSQPPTAGRELCCACVQSRPCYVDTYSRATACWTFPYCPELCALTHLGCRCTPRAAAPSRPPLIHTPPQA